MQRVLYVGGPRHGEMMVVNGTPAEALYGLGDLNPHAKETDLVPANVLMYKLQIIDGEYVYIYKYKQPCEEPKYICKNCEQVDVGYMVHPHIWSRAGLLPTDVCCLDCLEKRLGKLDIEYFTTDTANLSMFKGYWLGLRHAKQIKESGANSNPIPPAPYKVPGSEGRGRINY